MKVCIIVFGVYYIEIEVTSYIAGSKHTTQGYLVLFLALTVTMLDLFALATRVVNFFRAKEKFSCASFWTKAVLGEETSRNVDYLELAADFETPDDLEEQKTRLLAGNGSTKPHSTQTQQVQFSGETSDWANESINHHHRSFSRSSDGSLFSPSSPTSEHTLQELEATPQIAKPRLSSLRRIGQIAFAVLERSLVFGGLLQLLSGIVIYTGMLSQGRSTGKLTYNRWMQGKLYQRLPGTFDQWVLSLTIISC